MITVQPVQDLSTPEVGCEIDYELASPLVRRIQIAFFDLGLDRVVPTGWAVPTEGGVAFETLTLKQADQLVRALEDLALDYEGQRPKAGPEQLRLW
jgi:hypothetical protein